MSLAFSVYCVFSYFNSDRKRSPDFRCSFYFLSASRYFALHLFWYQCWLWLVWSFMIRPLKMPSIRQLLTARFLQSILPKAFLVIWHGLCVLLWWSAQVCVHGFLSNWLRISYFDCFQWLIGTWCTLCFIASKKPTEENYTNWKPNLATSDYIRKQSLYKFWIHMLKLFFPNIRI